MFTGIVESMATLISRKKEGSNLELTFRSPLSSGFKTDQSVSHNGICLTVVRTEGDTHTVVAIDETIRRSSIGLWEEGRLLNLERAAKIGDRLDGHIVQGHVDSVGICESVESRQGSWIVKVAVDDQFNELLVQKGSICLDGISLTVVDCPPGFFSVAIIPYTWENTSISRIQSGDRMNLEFDIVGKYVLRRLSLGQLPAVAGH